MRGKVTISINVTDKSATIDIINVTANDKRWIADALMDSFTVDDAYYNSNDELIYAQNWHHDVSNDTLRLSLIDLLHELDRDKIIFRY